MKPSVLPVKIEGIPTDLRSEKRWVLWSYVKRDGKWRKIPMQANGRPASSTDQKTWTDFESASDAYLMGDFDGLGFTLGDGFYGIDSDDSRSPDGSLNELGQRVLDSTEGYAEVSPSGTGFKVITRSRMDFSKNDSGGIGLEAYPAGRYFTITGHRMNGHDRLPDRDVDLSWLPPLFGAEAPTNASDDELDIKPIELLKGPIKDWPAERIESELMPYLDPDCDYGTWVMIGQALYHQFEGDPEGLRIWDEWSENGSKYAPGEPDKKWNTFTAEGGRRGPVTLATVIKLANDNPDKQNESLIRSQGEVSRLVGIIELAQDMVSLRANVIKEIKAADIDPIQREQIAQEMSRKIHQLTRSKPQIRDVREMIKPDTSVRSQGVGLPEWAQQYIWIIQEDKFMNMATSQLLTKMSFNALHNRDVQAAFGEGSLASDIALDIFRIPVVNQRVYLPTAGPTFILNGMTCVNSYLPNSVPEASKNPDQGAIKVVLDHIDMLTGNDKVMARHLIQWMAHNVKHPGKKILWSPLIKGIEGDGKTVLGKMLQGMMGLLNVGVVGTNVLFTDFNGWAEGRCVNIIEEIRITGHNRHDVANALKPNITNAVIAIHRKGLDEYNIPNTCNYIAFTNFEDALPLQHGDRRWLTIRTPFDGPEDLPGADYYAKLHRVVENYAADLKAYFLAVDMTGFEAEGRAPDSEFKNEMIAASTSDEEWEAQAILEEGALGVSKDVLSSAHLSAAIELRTGQKPNGQTMHKLLRKLGLYPVTIDNKSQIKWAGRACRVWCSREFLHKSRDFLREKLEETAKVTK